MRAGSEDMSQYYLEITYVKFQLSRGPMSLYIMVLIKLSFD